MAKRRKTHPPMSSEEAAFRATIIRDPDDDARRLVYADWLDDHGQSERAEFIRLQIALAGESAVPNRRELEAREKKLLKRNRAEWNGDLRGSGVLLVVYERGFPARVCATAEAFVRAGGGWFQRHPLQQVSLADVAGQADRLAAAPHLSAVRHLTINDPELHDDDLVELAEAPSTGGTDRFAILEGLCVDAGEFVGSRGLAALAQCALPQLRGTCFHGTRIDDRGAVAMADASGCPKLEILSLMVCRVGNEGLAALLASPRRKSLVSLALAYSRVNGGGLGTLAAMPEGSSLRELILHGSPIKRVDLNRLGAAFQKHSRLGLNLWECPIPQATREMLAFQFGERVFPGLRDCVPG